jgi:hypothetical protein
MGDTYTAYAIVSKETGKRYVGITLNPKERKKAHFKNLENKQHHSKKLQIAYDRNPNPALFEWVILEENIPPSHRNRRELHWMGFYNSIADGYNKAKPTDDTEFQNSVIEMRIQSKKNKEELVNLALHLRHLEGQGLKNNPHFLAIKDYLCKSAPLFDVYYSQNLADYVESESE